jgi:hypothetical protein
MNFQSATDPRMAETCFRVVQNAATATQTLTAASIALGAPVVLATNTDSLPSSVVSNSQNFVQKPATATSIVNNLFVGLLARVPGTKTYLAGQEVGLAQNYGPYLSGIVLRATAGASVGAVLVPNSLPNLQAVSGPTTGTAATEVPALGGLAVLMEALATSSATELTTARVFLRAM